MAWCMGSERTWSGGFVGKWENVLWAYRDQFSTDLVRIFTTRSSKKGAGDMKRSAGQRMGRREHAHTLAMALWSLLILRFRCERKHCKSTDGHAYSYKSDFNRSGGTDRYSFFPPSFITSSFVPFILSVMCKSPSDAGLRVLQGPTLLSSQSTGP